MAQETSENMSIDGHSLSSMQRLFWMLQYPYDPF